MEQICLPSIWSTSPCTLPFVNRAASFQKSKRFEFNSIYYKDDPFKVKQQQSPLSRPEVILNEFRKKIKQATKSYHTSSYIKKKKTDDPDQRSYQTINMKASQVTGRLYDTPHSLLQLKYDLNGNRSSFLQAENKNEKENRISGRSLSPKELKLHKLQHKECDNVYITSTPRTDFSKPLNFNPGPGSYLAQKGSRDLLEKSKMSGKSLGVSFDGKNTPVYKGSFDQKSSLVGSKLSENVKFSTLDHDESLNQRKNNLFLKRIEKSKNNKHHV